MRKSAPLEAALLCGAFIAVVLLLQPSEPSEPKPYKPSVWQKEQRCIKDWQEATHNAVNKKFEQVVSGLGVSLLHYTLDGYPMTFRCD
ncbi:MAG: hypothetical protein V7707_06310 [Motiliproteus sp.]